MAGQLDISFKLKAAIQRIPLIDSHAHGLPQSYELSPDFPRETLVSLAEGEALQDSVYSLAHIRMLKNLACFFNLPVDSSWQTINETAKARDYDLLCRDLIKAAGIQAILIDDGVKNDYLHDIPWRDGLTPHPNKRIVQIETLFESIVAQSGRTEAFFEFPAAIRKLANDPEVVGFKSIAAYRSGLDIEPLNLEGLAMKCEVAYRQVRDYPAGPFRVEKHDTVAWLINATCSVISGKGKPLQFHTGLIGANTTLSKSDVSLLQPLIRAYTKVPFVLLHSGYPCARPAGYLATVHHNVYLDFGLAISPLSGDGQRSLIRQLLELCPTNKLLWSSGTAFHPERVYLAALQVREALAEILTDYVRRDEIGFDEAIRVAKRMLFENANKLYKLSIDYVELGLEEMIQAEDNINERGSDDVSISTAIVYNLNPSAPREPSEPIQSEPSLPEVSESRRVTKTPSETISTLLADLKSRNIKFVRIAWVDYVSFTRYHTVPLKHFTELVSSPLDPLSSLHPSERLAESGFSVVQAALGMQVNGQITPGVSSLGYYDLRPDLSTIWNPSFAKGYAHMMGRFFHKAIAGGKELETCPRTILQRVIWKAEQELGVKFLVGFETGFMLLQGNSPAYAGVTNGSMLQCGPVADCVHEIVQAITDAGINLYTYDVKVPLGQYQLITGPLPPMQAADVLVTTREIIHCTAQKHNYRATLVPRLCPYSSQGSTSSQVHISVQSASSSIPSNHPDVPSLPKDLASFMSGLLMHLDSVCMFTLPLDSCYPRNPNDPLNASFWACWSTENMEAPVRLCSSERGGFNVEVRTFDGTANPYLGLAAILGAGLAGLKEQATLEMRQCCSGGSDLTEDRRRDLRIMAKMPTQNAMFELGLEERMEFVNSWLSEEAWKLYKGVREHESNTFYPLQAQSGYHGTYYTRPKPPTAHCHNYY
ncbi:glutamine synthetase/guanido kinase [Ceratobasidium sp. AG-I]|nr:glutamine synthetase/guanido kinase [Ceratobasidium sp. AG-I]